MSRKTCKRVSFSPDVIEMPKLSFKRDSATGSSRKFAGICNLRLPRSNEFQPARFLRRAGASMTRAFRLVLVRRRVAPKASSPNSRSRPSVSPHDSHRTEAIEDCIEFINSSCSFQRSNSVPTYLCY